MSSPSNSPYQASRGTALAFMACVKFRYQCWRFDPRMRQALCGRVDLADLDALIHAVAGLHDGRWPPRLLRCARTRRATLTRIDTLLRRYGVSV